MNTIVFAGIMRDGTVIEYDHNIQEHVNEKRVDQILNGDLTELVAFIKGLGGGEVRLNLDNGYFMVDGQIIDSKPPKSKLRPIFHRVMTGDSADLLNIENKSLAYVVVGWQTTYKGKNIKKGIKYYPGQPEPDHFELTEDV